MGCAAIVDETPQTSMLVFFKARLPLQCVAANISMKA
jgi:hypothetical protein